jgi:hypothetical protein
MLGSMSQMLKPKSRRRIKVDPALRATPPTSVLNVHVVLHPKLRVAKDGKREELPTHNAPRIANRSSGSGTRALCTTAV